VRHHTYEIVPLAPAPAGIEMRTWVEIRGPCTYGTTDCVLPRSHIGECVTADGKCPRLDSNQRPRASQARALSD
jgi:hypothetical protein